MTSDHQEPPITEQMGLTGERQSRKFRKGAPIRRHERPELFNAMITTLNGFELWITPYNRIFLVDAQTGAVGYPRLLATGIIGFEPALANVPVSVIVALSALLERQKALRRKMVEQGEYDDDQAWEWS
jgi:hypothetical protein